MTNGCVKVVKSMSVKLEDAGLDRLDSITKIANPNVVFCRESDSVITVIGKMVSSGYRRIPVVSKNDMLVGILASMDVLDAFLRGHDLDEKVETIMVREVVYCNSSDTIGYTLQRFKLSRRGGFPIVEDGKLIGIVTERDFVRCFSDITFGMPVGEVMTPKPFIVHSGISILDCLKSIVNTRYRRLPVVEKDRLVAMVTAGDLLRYVVEHNFSFEDMDEPLDNVVIKKVFTISKEKDVSEAIKIMKKNNIGGIPVTENSYLEGIITEKDILDEII